jgi:uncharacterized protein DUF6614
MDHDHIFCDLRDRHRDVRFVDDVHAYLGHLRALGLLEDYHVARRKLGFGPPGLGEFHITIRTRDLAQLDAMFQKVAERAGEVQKLHAAVYGAVAGAQFLLDRDFPDAVRAR